MSEHGFWSRIRRSRLAGVLLVYLGASWLVIQVANELREALELPDWVAPLAVILLLIGLVVVLATAWVQSHPLTPERAAREEVPSSWELDLGELAGSIRRGRLPHLTWSRALLGGLVAFSLLFGMAGVYVVISDRGRSFAPRPALAEDAAPGIAVLPFSVRGQGTELLREGMVDLLSTNLDGAAGLRAIDSRTVLARWRERVPGDEEPDLATALEVARRADARYAVVGAAVSTGTTIRLTAEIRDLRDGRSLEPARVDGPADPESLIALADRFTARVLHSILAGSGRETPVVSLASVTTESFTALRSFLEGESLYRRGAFEEAAGAYESAVAADSSFALAWYRLGLSRWWLLNREDLDERALERAVAHVGALPVREATLARASLAFLRRDPAVADTLKAAVARYPDEPEAWYMLGETYFHQVVPTGLDEPRRIFERAVELDPGFAPYQVHMVDLAFRDRPDSAVAASVVERYGRLAPGSTYDRAHRLQLALSFGDSTTRAEARAALDTAAVETLRLTGIYHPRFWPQQEAVLRAIRRRGHEAAQRTALQWLFINSVVQRGWLDRALEFLEDPLAPPAARICMLQDVDDRTGAVPDSLLEANLSLEPVLSGPPPASEEAMTRLYCGAQLAARRGRWEEFEAARERLAGVVEGMRASGDTVNATQMEADLRWLEGWGLWKRGAKAEALAAFDEAWRGGAFIMSVPPGRLAMGELLLELQRPEEALPWFQSMEQQALPSLYLARAYEALGEPAEAREAYEFFLRWWGDADPELQPMVNEAREALERIAAELR